MKTSRSFINKFRYHLTLGLSFLISCGSTPEVLATPPSVDAGNTNIKIALLLDTSNSMDGLIEQAKTQLWTIVNELSEAKCEDDSAPELEIALYEYGNDGISEEKGHIRQVCPLTGDLDLISEKLFALKTNGGNEFCGQVIAKSLTDVEWGTNENDLKMIFIAGNEPFTQGKVNYATACGDAKAKGIVVNSIFCGEFNQGITSSWKTGADITAGSYMSINQNTRTVFIESPYDNKIDSLNTELNETYIPYGTYGERKKELQLEQDENAESYSISNKVSRITTKSKGIYKNEAWDLVDGMADDESLVGNLEEEQLPEEMKKMSVEERKTYVVTKTKDRDAINIRIKDLSVLRQSYVTEEKKKLAVTGSTLDQAMVEAIRLQAKTKGLKF